MIPKTARLRSGQISSPRASDALSLARQALRSGIRINSTLLNLSPHVYHCLRERRAPTATEIRTLFESLGVTYIKLGQFIASSPTLFPADYVEAFQDCLDNTPASKFSVIKRCIEKELGHPLEHTFRYVEQSPLASASIAQVHGAVLHNGERVVIKVQKPGIENIIDTDLNFAFVVSRVLELVSPALDTHAITDIISEIHRSMRAECDFIQEANNIIAFNTFLAEQSITGVVAPKVYPQVSTTRMLTMQRIEGTAFTAESFGGNDQLQSARFQSALFSALNAWFLSLQHCDFFHADLHRGNLILTPDQRVAFIDFGMVGRISPSIWSAAVALFESLGSEDYQRMAEAMIGVGMTRQQVDAKQLAADLQGVLSANWQAHDAAAAQRADSPLITVSRIARKHGLRFPSAFTLLLKQLLYFDSYLQLLAPETNLFDQASFDGFS